MKRNSGKRSNLAGTLSLSSKAKIILLALAFIIIVSTLWYTHDLVTQLSRKEKEIAGLYARSFEYLASGSVGDGEYNFLFNEIIKAIDFPVVMTDAKNEPIYPFRIYTKNILIDTALSKEKQREYLKNLIQEMDEKHSPIRITYQDTIVLNYLHYGESDLIIKLRQLPYIEIVVVALFVLIGYISFSYVKRSEQSSIWVGMARETAHQLGTPISSILGWIELLKDKCSGDSKIIETLVNMESDVKRLQKITERFSKIGSKPDLNNENIVELIKSVTEYFKKRIPQTGKKIQLEIHAPVSVNARVNRELFEWAIENLTKNSLDAIENNEGVISYDIREEEKYIYVDVSDTGKGIEAKYRKDIFRPGFSTKKRGWGLGLSLTKRIIEMYHNGKLMVVKSKSGFKTTFRIKLKK